MIEVIQIPALQDNYIYFIIDKQSSLTACVDPSLADPVINLLKKKNLKLDFILNTHHHYDHVGGNLELKEKTQCKIIGAEIDKERIPGIDICLKDKENFFLGSSKFIAIETPGHTVGHICFYFDGDNILFSGDTLFALGCGRLFEGTPKQMWSSLKFIKNLPNETLIYCGHEYTESNSKFAISLLPDDKDLEKKKNKIKSLRKKGIPTIPTTIGEEKRFNPFLKIDDDEFLEKIDLKNLEENTVFEKIRKLKDIF